MLFNALKPFYKSPKETNWHYHFDSGGVVCTALNEIVHIPPKNGHMYFTHRDATDVLNNSKVVHIYANPINIAISVNEGGRGFGKSESEKEHFIQKFYRYKEANHDKRELWTKQDVLGLKQHFLSWYRPNPFQTLSIKYEKLWDNVGAINDFLNIELKLPPFRQRRVSCEDHPLIDELNETYAEAMELFLAAEEVKLW